MLAQATQVAAPDSALEALLIVAAVVLGLAYCLFLISCPGQGCVVTICGVLLFSAGYFPAVAMGVGKAISAGIGVSAAGVACLVLFLIYRKIVRRSEREMHARREEWERRAKDPKSMDEMRQYWNRGE
ncbi:hypothetical protein [Streptomyces sp. DH41]|uniref:hypothetical protein n=1 Tax=Streptomyces sp. DH41 TaxID=3040125 RepID=UPI0024414D99|nr:hypothetical protein [Streptomyces sp. DH41]MDG9728676.1 hypothetical protein [Streptomyces sp. DH41]